MAYCYCHCSWRYQGLISTCRSYGGRSSPMWWGSCRGWGAGSIASTLQSCASHAPLALIKLDVWAIRPNRLPLFFLRLIYLNLSDFLLAWFCSSAFSVCGASNWIKAILCAIHDICFLKMLAFSDYIGFGHIQICNELEQACECEICVSWVMIYW